MKEKGIIFSSEMVNAILEGRKTQTRRVIKPQPSFKIQTDCFGLLRDYEGKIIKCPYGIGCRLYVKENYFLNKNHNNIPASQAPHDSLVMYQAGGEANVYGRKRSSMFMPKWASRITLEITDIRVERLQNISEEDSISEGCYTNEKYYDLADGDENIWACSVCNGRGVHGALGQNLGVTEVDCLYCDTAKKRFLNLWQKIKGKESWEQNPFVWCLTFKVIKK